jgi:hypothetical protein
VREDALPAIARAPFPVHLEGQLRAGGGGDAAQGTSRWRRLRIQLRINHGIDTAEEEAGHRGHARHRQLLRDPPFETGEKGLDHFAITAQPEDQRDIDVDAIGEVRSTRIRDSPVSSAQTSPGKRPRSSRGCGSTGGMPRRQAAAKPR